MRSVHLVVQVARRHLLLHRQTSPDMPPPWERPFTQERSHRVPSWKTRSSRQITLHTVQSHRPRTRTHLMTGTTRMGPQLPSVLGSAYGRTASLAITALTCDCRRSWNLRHPRRRGARLLSYARKQARHHQNQGSILEHRFLHARHSAACVMEDTLTLDGHIDCCYSSTLLLFFPSRIGHSFTGHHALYKSHIGVSYNYFDSF
jgi:hypothetical protein